MQEQQSVISSIIFSSFEREGPVPIYSYPDVIDDDSKFIIAMKSISLLMGEQVYQEGRDLSLAYFGILPFPDIKLVSLTYFFLILDETARGKAKASTISLLVPQDKSQFLYNNIKQLSMLISETADIITKDTSRDELEKIIKMLYDKLLGLTSDFRKLHLNSSVTIKMVFTGLDASGKTSFLRKLKKQYSQLLNAKPTKGFKHSQDSFLGKNITEWDIGGQHRYREKFLRDAEIYLYDTNVLFYLVDGTNPERFDESLDYYSKILEKLAIFDQKPYIQICFHKIDPELRNDNKIKESIEALKEKFKKLSKGFNISFFTTSIFDEYSITHAYSHAINKLSPNKEAFEAQLRWLAHHLKAERLLLLGEFSIILGVYPNDDGDLEHQDITEITAPHFNSLFKTFKEFNLLKSDTAVWQMDPYSILLKKLSVGSMELMLFIMYRTPITLDAMESSLNTYLNEFIERITPLLQAYL